MGIERNGEHAAQHAAVKGGDPLGAVFSPDENAIALDDASRREKRRKPAGEARQLTVGGHAATVTLVAHHRDLAVKAAKVVNQRSEVIAHRVSGKAFPLPLSPDGDAAEWLFPLEKAFLLYRSDLTGAAKTLKTHVQLEILANQRI